MTGGAVVVILNDTKKTPQQTIIEKDSLQESQMLWSMEETLSKTSSVCATC